MPTDPSRGQRRRRRRGAGAVTLAVIGGVALGGYGIGAHVVPALTPQSCRVTVGEHEDTLEPEQAGNAATIAAVGLQRDVPVRGVTIALATALQESKLRNLDHGDRDSLGLFQQRPSQGWGTPEQVRDPVYASRVFYAGLLEVDDYLERPLTEAAQDVQRSGHPDAYAQHEQRASRLADAYAGVSREAVTCTLDPPEHSTDPETLAAEVGDLFEVPVDATPTGIAAEFPSEDLAWAGAHWAVSHAARTGARAVTVGERSWIRDRAGDATRWHEAPADTAAGSATRVVVTLDAAAPRQ